MTKGALIRLSIAIVTTVAAAVASVAPVHAVEAEEPIEPKVEDGWSTSVDYGPMPVSEASAVRHDPETCKSLPWCTLVRVIPQFPDGWQPDIDEFVMTTVISWDSTPIVQGTVESNDLDIYAYTYEDVIQADGTTQKKYREVNRAASGSQPERMKLFGTTPDNPTLYIVVYNFNGPNLGFRIDLDVNVVKYADPDSYYPAAPGLAGSGDFPSDGSGTSFEPVAPVPFARPAYEPSLPSDLPSIAPDIGVDPGSISLAPSASFAEGFGSFRSLSEDLAAPGGQGILDAIRSRAVGTPKPVGAAVLVFWLVLVPLALVGSSGVWLMRRRPAALRIAA